MIKKLQKRGHNGPNIEKVGEIGDIMSKDLDLDPMTRIALKLDIMSKAVHGSLSPQLFEKR